MSGLSGYDAWRTACPPDPSCAECGATLGDERGGCGEDLCPACAPRCVCDAVLAGDDAHQGGCHACTERLCIVIAWTEGNWIHDGEPYRADVGQRPGMIAVRVPRAVVWLSDGTAEDRERAEAYVTDRPEARVYTYPVDESDPLGRAKADVMAEVAA